MILYTGFYENIKKYPI